MHLPSDFKGRFFERMIGLASTGFSEDDTHVSLFVANPTLKKGSISTPVQTTQIAPTILQLLGLDPNKLQAVGIENTQILPGL